MINVWIAFAAILPISIVAFRRIGTTAIDRRLVLSVPFMFLMQALVATGACIGDLPLVVWQLGYPLMWCAMIGLVALLAEPRITPAALGYLAAFLIAVRFPSSRWYVISAANALLTLNALAWYRMSCRHHSSRDAARS
jgi:hypothetical protein